MKRHCKFLIIFIFLWSALYSQDIVWDDYAPFSKTIVAQGVQKDSLVTLTPIYELDGNDIQLENFTLQGFDWEWPHEQFTLGRVEDIDVRTRTDSTDLYLITDSQREAGKLFIFNPGTNIIVWNYNGDELESPIDAYEFVDANQRYFLVTDRGSHRVMQIDYETQSVVWDYGDSLGRGGSGLNQLDDPADAQKIADASQYVIADKGNDRVIIVDQEKNILWQVGPDVLNNPVDVEYLAEDGHILVTDQGNDRVVLLSRADSSIVWQYPGSDSGPDDEYDLLSPIDADVLENGHILIADAGHNRVVEVDPANEDYFWELQLSLVGLRDVDQIGSSSRNNEKLMVVNVDQDLNTTVPARVGFASGWRESPMYTIDQEVNFDSLFWDAKTNGGQNTSLALQFRSGSDVSDIALQPWTGPLGDTASTYTESGTKLANIHKSHTVYQYRAFLQTESPKETPVLNGVTVKYYHYNTGTISPRPYFWASNIGIAESDSLVPHWISFEVEQRVPADPVKRSELDLLFRFIENKRDTINPGNSYRTLHEFTINHDSSKIKIDLEDIPGLWGVSSMNLNGYPSTRNSSVSPALVSWKLVYELVKTSASEVKFVDFEAGDTVKVHGYNAFQGTPGSGQNPDMVGIYLDDNNLESALSVFTVPVTVLISGDQEYVQLLNKGSHFRNDVGMPITITDTFTPFNDTLEVVDRDTLLVAYQDVNDNTDISSDRVLVVMATDGDIFVQDSKGANLQNVEIGQELYVRITGENDKNLDLVKQDSIKVTVEETSAGDSEAIWLYEVASGDNIYNSGEFVNRAGIPVTDKDTDTDPTDNDGRLQTSYGSTVSAKYVDNIVLEKRVNVPREPSIVIDLGGKPYIVEVAPNPYYEKTATNFRLRVASTEGSIEVMKIEIYDLAGEKVKEIAGTELSFNYHPIIPVDRYGVIEHWWDLYNDSGQPVSSGTYFLKVHAKLTIDETAQVENVAFYQKFMVVR